MLAFDTAWMFLKSDVLEKDYKAAQRAAAFHGLPDATTSAIRHPMGDLDSQMAPVYTPDKEEDQMSPEEAEMELMLQRRIAEMQEQRRNIQPLRRRSPV